ncbi:HAD-IIA family hydrolase [Mariniluteicoccus endophyticus]
MSDALVTAYDVALFDLDGVIYLGPAPVEGAAEGVAVLRTRGVRVGFVTNNAARTPDQVAAHLSELGVAATAADVVTSSQAGARVLADRLPAGSAVLVVGTDALRAEVEKVGLRCVERADDRPAAVIQGYHPQLPWPLIDEAAHAIQAGALWVATNTDATRPTDRGLVAGAGAQIGALRNAVDVDPVVAGKPHAPLMDESARRLEAQHAIFVGDRLDTDVDGAAGIGMDSLFVFTGAHGKHDLLEAANQPTYLGHDLRALLEPARYAVVEADVARCGHATARIDGTTVVVDGAGDTRDSQLDALRCVLALVSRDRDLDGTAAVDTLDQVR